MTQFLSDEIEEVMSHPGAHLNAYEILRSVRELEDQVKKLRWEARDSRKRAKYNAELADRRLVGNERLLHAAEKVLWFLDRHLPPGGYITFHIQVEELRAAIEQARTA